MLTSDNAKSAWFNTEKHSQMSSPIIHLQPLYHFVLLICVPSD